MVDAFILINSPYQFHADGASMFMSEGRVDDLYNSDQLCQTFSTHRSHTHRALVIKQFPAKVGLRLQSGAAQHKPSSFFAHFDILLFPVT